MEANNQGNIILLKEGSFWKAYERSAYLFTTFKKPMKLKISDSRK